MRRTERKIRRRTTLELEIFESRRLLAGLAAESIAAPFGPLPAAPLELPQVVAPGESLAAVALNDAAWLASQRLTGAGQTVAVIDSGIAFDHEALGAGFGAGYKVVGGWDFAENDALPYDDGPAGFHGTHIAGIIAGRDGFRTGVAPDAQLVALRVFNDSGATQGTWIQNALRWVHDHRFSFASPITAVNLSIGTADSAGDGSLAKLLEPELAQLRADNIFVAVSAGNRFHEDAPTQLSYPASSFQVTPVASVGADGRLSDFSQRNARVLAAPGEEIVSTAPDFLLGADGRNNDYVASTGTSMAAPYVAAASLLVRETLRRTTGAEPTVAQIEQVLRDGADQIDDPATQVAIARVQLRRTLERLLSPAMDDAVRTAVPVAATAWPTGDSWQHSLSELGGTRGANAGWYRWHAARTGLASIQASGSTTIEAFDRNGLRLAVSRTTAAGSRLDLRVWEGDAVFFRLTGGDATTQIQLQNLVRLDGASLVIADTPQDDVLQVAWDAAVRVSLNGVEYAFPSASVSSVEWNGSSGRDSAKFDSSRSSDTWRVILSPTLAEARSNSGQLRFSGVEEVELAAGLLRDEATIADGVEADTFRIDASGLEWSNAARDVRLYGFDYVRLTATRGGVDKATLLDSHRDDLLDLRGGEVRWNTGSATYVLQGLEQLEVDASRGGLDRVQIRDSVGDDQLDLRSDRLRWTTPTLTAVLRGFEQLVAVASAGGVDSAFLQGSAGDDRLRLAASEIQFVWAGRQAALAGFASVTADGGDGGRDRVTTETGMLVGAASSVDDARTIRFPTSTIKVRKFSVDDAAAIDAGTTPSVAELPPSPDDRVRAIDYLYKKLGITP
ncbi:MAG: S8 family serine peptidase [Pirellulales bacterium]